MTTHTTTKCIRLAGRLVLALLVLGSVACQSAGNVRSDIYTASADQGETAPALNESGGESSAALDDSAVHAALLGQLHHQDEGASLPENPATLASNLGGW